MRFAIAVVLTGAITVGACSDDGAVLDSATTAPAPTAVAPTSAPASGGTDSEAQAFPDIVDVTVSAEGDTFRFDVTVSSPYDTPERYADAWRILAPDGTELGVRELTHDHAAEQPFTRSLTGVEVPPDVTEVTVEGRDLVNGWGGSTFVATIDR